MFYFNVQKLGELKEDVFLLAETARYQDIVYTVD